MSLSLTKRLSLAAPPPKVVLLPDAHFFVRAIDVPPAATHAEIAAQAELALEAMAPFAVAQMYHGHHWREGFAHALVFAAYKKRFTAEQVETWNDAEVVAPAFATLLNAKVPRATTVMLTTAEGVTAIHWENPDDAPTAVLSRAFVPEMEEAARAQARDDIFRTLGGTRTELELSEEPVVDREDDSAERVFVSGKLVSGFSREGLDAIDVRDKSDLDARRRMRSRDLLMWRTFVGCGLALAFAALLELGMIAGEAWQKNRRAVVARQAPVVDEIDRANRLATRIEELSTKRLLPFEMLDIIAAKKPESILFTVVSANANQVNTLDVTATATGTGEVDTYRTALLANPMLEVKFDEPNLGNGGVTFRMKVTFKPDAVKPESLEPPKTAEANRQTRAMEVGS